MRGSCAVRERQLALALNKLDEPDWAGVRGSWEVGAVSLQVEGSEWEAHEGGGGLAGEMVARALVEVRG